MAPSKEEYSNLCLLLTMNKLSDHPEYKNWNPSKGRIQCFREILPLVQDMLGGDGQGQGGEKTREKVLGEVTAAAPASQPQQLVATNDRLLQLIIKGILYESCVDFCQSKATGSKTASDNIEFTDLLAKSDFSDSDLSLLSWLQSIPSETFACPFEQRSLNVDVQRIKAPQLETRYGII